MKILLLGKNGQIGWELLRSLATLGEVIAPARDELDLLDAKAIRDTVRKVRPELIVNAAAYTAVDRAEAEPDLAMALNCTAPGILAEEAQQLKAYLIHYSTDYVFDGSKGFPYTEEDEPKPLNVYGRSKLAGERAIQETGAQYLIFRTSWVYGWRGKNFLLTVLRLAREKKELRIVDDQFGSPTWCRMVAEATAQVVARGGTAQQHLQGIYHLSAAGETSWYGFARAVISGCGKKQFNATRLLAIRSRDFPAAASRPSYTVLSCLKVQERFALFLPHWKHLLNLVLAELQVQHD